MSSPGTPLNKSALPLKRAVEFLIVKQGGVLMKLGAIRVSGSNNPLAESAAFTQILKLRDGEKSDISW
jgi:hypothetical protein